jgi:AI-2 transport protein TqsA
LFNFVPNVGSIMAAVPAVGLAFLQAGTPTALGAAAVFIAVNCFISYVIEPRFMGQGLGLSTLVVFLSLVFWGWVLGPIGMLLSAPLTMIVKIILDDYDSTRWIAILLSSKPPTLDAKGKAA